MVFKQLKKIVLSIGDDLPEDFSSIIVQLKDIVRAINILQNNVSDSLSPMVILTQNDSIILTKVVLKSAASLPAGQTTNIIKHKLNRNLSGWYAIRKRNQATLWDQQDSNLAPNNTLWINTSTDVTVDLLVF